jgi:hypothetical protein
MCTDCMKASLLPNGKLCSFEVKSTLCRLLHFGPENSALHCDSLLLISYLEFFIAATTS